MSEENRIESRKGISFSLKRGCLLIYDATTRSLGEPEYVRLLYNARRNRLAVQVCEPIDKESFCVPEHIDGEKYQFEINSVSLLTMIYKNCGWGQDKTYMCLGMLHNKYRLVDFDLNQSREIAPELFCDPGLENGVD